MSVIPARSSVCLHVLSDVTLVLGAPVGNISMVLFRCFIGTSDSMTTGDRTSDSLIGVHTKAHTRLLHPQSPSNQRLGVSSGLSEYTAVSS